MRKYFGQVKAVDGISFTVQRGEIFSLLGPNGAGKTTTISTICCLLQPNAGDVLVMGHLHKPRLIVMDEPTAGIDPQSRRNILDGVMQLNREGATVLYTTHYMEEAQELSDHIAIMDHGKLIALGTHAELIKLVGQQTRIDLAVSAESENVLQAWQETEGVSRAFAEAEDKQADGKISVLVDDSNRVLPRLFEAATRHGARITSVDIREPNLEAVFLHLTGRALRD